MDQNFETALDSFQALMQATIQEHYDRNGFTLAPPTITVTRGKRYAKLIAEEYRPDGSRLTGSVRAFVDTTSGDILMPAGAKAPAKHARGNIFDGDGGASSMNDQGLIRYLK